MSASILRRIDSVVRADMEKAKQQPAAGSKDGQG